MLLPLRGTEAALLLVLAALAAGCADATGPSERLPDGRPGQPRSADASSPLSDRAHVHDLWGDETTLTLFDGNVPLYVAHNHLFDEPPREQHTHGCDESLTSDSQGGSVKFGLPPPTTVLPGSRALEFTFSWTDPSVMGVRFLYRAANAHQFADGGRATNREPLRIEVSPEMTDDGHAMASHWAFFLCADSDQPMDLAQGSVTVLAVALKADEIPLEPAHPHVWKGYDQHTLARQTWSGESRGALNKGDGTFHWVPNVGDRLVPFDARQILVNVTLSPRDALPGVPPVEVLVYWRDPTVPEWVYQKAEPAPGQAGNLTLGIPVGEEMTDSVYAEQSLWDFWIRLTSPQRTEAPSGLGTWSAPHQYDGGLVAEVTVFR